MIIIIFISISVILTMLMNIIHMKKRIEDLRMDNFNAIRKIAKLERIKEDCMEKLNVHRNYLFDISVLEDINNTLSKEIGYLRNKLKNNSNGFKVNDEIIKKAARKAMIYSHPDKGGNTDEFIMFKDLYDKVK